MEYPSILFDHLQPSTIEQERHSSDFLQDIHMDKIIQDIVKGKEEYGVEPLFYRKLESIESIRYRIAIMKEIDRSVSVHSMEAFSRSMLKVREYAQYSRSFADRDQRMKWLLDAAHLYCEAVMELHHTLGAVELQSKGLKRFQEWLTYYIHTSYFSALFKATCELQQVFSGIRFSMAFAGGKIKIVIDDDDQEDYCRALSRVFLQGQGNEEIVEMHLSGGLQLTEAETTLLNAIKKEHPEPFRKLQTYYARHMDFIESSLMVFDREIQFYVACLQYFQALRKRGLAYNYPKISDTNDLRIRGGYDLSLASSAFNSDQAIIGNHLDLEAQERICVLTGPNQGGKTTFVRSIGQIFHLSSIGCPVPCEEAVLFDFDRIFTHFPSQELPGDQSGKLKDELHRLKPILEESTGRSVILLNELFFTTTTHDAYAMGSSVLRHLLRKGSMCLYVTHVFELAAAHDRIVSLVAVTEDYNPAKRTFRIRRQRADGLVHASSIAGKYGLTRQRLKERIQL
ncbi:hypothetical protein J4772_13045 [Cohnella sp. LGH]|uniref:MutS-related protein n=1 Tax=Cohnella sp. LGH TaxID=1619153 RepID=UPI001AD9C8D9|nr:hypothetical protein [Cohnella sp. LGH]QTH45246.1 hypothetical protein J4772_13045 [Cohnella sp. LGH]